MKAFILSLDGTLESARRALGAVACANVKSSQGKRLFDKGHVFAEGNITVLSQMQGIGLSLIMPEDGDVHENEAALRLARAVAGEGVEATGPSEAKARLVARDTGLLRVDAGTLEAMNSIPTVSIYTLLDGQPVMSGVTVAEAKVTPLVVAAADIEEAEAFAANDIAPTVAVLPFVPVQAAALIRERISPAQAQRVAEGLSNKLKWFGSTLEDVQYVAPDASAEAIAAAMRNSLVAREGLLLVSGGSASDPSDPLLSALDHISARIERIGIPAHPGSMLWLAYAGDVPIVGVPSCGIFSQVTSFDLVLPTLLAGQPVTSATFASLGHGGLLQAADPRLPRYGE